MSRPLILKARAKINLGLSVVGSRIDGFHQLETVMQQVSLHDTLFFEPDPANNTFTLLCSEPELCGPHNLVNKAAELIKEQVCTNLPGVRVRLYKNIPLAAGLAGGSSDAAATLLGLNQYWQLGLSQEILVELAQKLGSDVPFCLSGGTALARGRGEELEQLPLLPFFWTVIALPKGVEFSTAEAYQRFDRGQLGKPDLRPLVQAIKNRSRAGITDWLKSPFTNTLETASLPGSGTVKAFKEALQENGLNPVFSGSGPAFFMLTESYLTAGNISRLVEEHGGISYMCWTSGEKRFAVENRE